MSLPTANASSYTIVKYSADLSGRLEGVLTLPSLVPDPERRGMLTAVGERIVVATRSLMTAWVARVTHELFDNRRAIGAGRGIDRGWDGTVAEVSQAARLSLPDRSTDNPTYRAVFENGRTDQYTRPSIGRDPELAADLRRRVEASDLPARAAMLERLDAIAPHVTAGAAAVEAGEARLNELFAAEIAARQALVNLLWEERKTVERLLGRAGRNLASFVFFDFDGRRRPGAGSDGEPTDEPTTGTGSDGEPS